MAYDIKGKANRIVQTAVLTGLAAIATACGKAPEVGRLPPVVLVQPMSHGAVECRYDVETTLINEGTPNDVPQLVYDTWLTKSNENKRCNDNGAYRLHVKVHTVGDVDGADGIEGLMPAETAFSVETEYNNNWVRPNGGCNSGSAEKRVNRHWTHSLPYVRDQCTEYQKAVANVEGYTAIMGQIEMSRSSAHRAPRPDMPHVEGLNNPGIETPRVESVNPQK